jgi:hypothetical protein
LEGIKWIVLARPHRGRKVTARDFPLSGKVAILLFPELLDELACREKLLLLLTVSFCQERPLYTGVENRGCIVYWRLIKLGVVLVELGPIRIDARGIVARFHPMCYLSLCFLQRRKEEFVYDRNLPNNSILDFSAPLTNSELTAPFKPQKARIEHSKNISEPTEGIPVCVTQ